MEKVFIVWFHWNDELHNREFECKVFRTFEAAEEQWNKWVAEQLQHYHEGGSLYDKDFSLTLDRSTHTFIGDLTSADSHEEISIQEYKLED